jgi:hypothetical protein
MSGAEIKTDNTEEHNRDEFVKDGGEPRVFVRENGLEKEGHKNAEVNVKNDRNIECAEKSQLSQGNGRWKEIMKNK